MNNEKIKSKLKEIVKKQSKFFEDEITEETNLVDNLGLDSVAMIELITEIEINLEIEFDFMEIDFGDIVIYKNLEKFVLSKCNK